MNVVSTPRQGTGAHLSEGGAAHREDATGDSPSRIALAILLTSIFVTCFDNIPFWSAVHRLTASEDHQGAILTVLFLVQLFSVNAVLALAFGPRALKAAGGTVLVFAAAVGFFMTEYGVRIDASMIRNVVETDVKEVASLLSGAFFIHLIFFGIVPAAALAVAPLGRPHWTREAAARAAIAGLSAVAVLGFAYANLATLGSFGQEHRRVRMLVNPGYPVYASLRLLMDTLGTQEATDVVIDAAATRAAPAGGNGKHTLVVFVLGETARADRFSLNGYSRNTSRSIEPMGVVNFRNVTSCGTSTADSVPCIFSNLGRAQFDHAAAARHESLLGLLQRLDIEVFWRDNNSGCKQVCDPARFESLASATDEALCDANGCYDEILLRALEERISDSTRDRFIVLHQRGSHGPAYYKDVPPWAKQYAPECRKANLRDCSAAQIDNAYDNTIAYTSYFLSKVVEFLRTQQQQYDVALFYVSDHGESLGERGIYLHGFPYEMAPEEQIHVPMMFWGTTAFLARTDVTHDCTASLAGNDYTHDNVFHTMLGLFGINSSEYRRGLDIFAPCRHISAGPPDLVGVPGGETAG